MNNKDPKRFTILKDVLESMNRGKYKGCGGYEDEVDKLAVTHYFKNFPEKFKVNSKN